MSARETPVLTDRQVDMALVVFGAVIALLAMGGEVAMRLNDYSATGHYLHGDSYIDSQEPVAARLRQARRDDVRELQFLVRHLHRRPEPTERMDHGLELHDDGKRIDRPHRQVGQHPRRVSSSIIKKEGIYAND